MSEAETYRSLVLQACDIAVDYTNGRLRSDLVAQAITQGKGGSSCGFLLHWACYIVGIREPWVNRDGVGEGYRIGKNLSLLFGGLWNDKKSPRCLRRVYRSDVLTHANLIIMENPARQNDDHVCIVAKDYEGGTEFLSYDYGQRGAGGKEEDGRFCRRDVHQNSSNRTTLRGGKQILAMLDIVELIAEAKKNGNLVDPVDPVEWLRGVRGEDGS